MTRRRITTVAGFALLLLATVLVAEATLGTLILVFALVLGVNLNLQVAPPAFVNMWIERTAPPDVTLYTGAVLASLAFTAACGVGAATRRFMRWRPGT